MKWGCLAAVTFINEKNNHICMLVRIIQENREGEIYEREEGNFRTPELGQSMHRGAWPFRSISGFFDVLSGIG
jgi:hypothetical protein